MEHECTVTYVKVGYIKDLKGGETWMIRRLRMISRKKLLAAVIICVVLMTGSTTLWQMGHVAEAAILDPHPGLVAWWRFDEGTDTVAKDSSGYGNDGAIYGATSMDGKHGKALSFDGTDDYVDCGNDASLNFNGDFTICGWTRCSSEEEYRVITQKIKSSKGWYVRRYKSKHSYQFLLGNGTHIISAIGDDVIDDGEWHFFTAIRNTTAGKIFIYTDGVYDNEAEDTLEGDVYDADAKALISIVTTSRWLGEIDEIRFYNRALSQAETHEIFQKTPDFSSKLLAKIPKGTTQVIVTASWQGIGSLNATIDSPSESYTEDMVPVYQKTSYSTSGGTLEMLNIKRLSISIPASSSDENWYITLDYSDVKEYTITVEIQK